MKAYLKVKVLLAMILLAFNYSANAETAIYDGKLISINSDGTWSTIKKAKAVTDGKRGIVLTLLELNPLPSSEDREFCEYVYDIKNNTDHKVSELMIGTSFFNEFMESIKYDPKMTKMIAPNASATVRGKVSIGCDYINYFNAELTQYSVIKGVSKAEYGSLIQFSDNNFIKRIDKN